MSDNYYDIKYHFRSIDTWLRGIHKYFKYQINLNFRSFCEEHKWHDSLLDDDKKNKYSLFSEDLEGTEKIVNILSLILIIILGIC